MGLLDRLTKGPGQRCRRPVAVIKALVITVLHSFLRVSQRDSACLAQHDIIHRQVTELSKSGNQTLEFEHAKHDFSNLNAAGESRLGGLS